MTTLKPTAMDLLLRGIFDGNHDAYLAELLAAIVERKKAIARRGLIGLQIGATIRFAATIRPAYLRGLTAKVKKVNGASVVVDIDNNPSYGRFSGSRNVRVPATLVEPVKA